MSGLIKIKLNILDQQQKETKNWFPLKNVDNNKVLLFLKHQTDNFALSYNGILGTFGRLSIVQYCHFDLFNSIFLRFEKCLKTVISNFN